MGSLFDDLMADVGVPVLMDALGDPTSITYTPAGGVAVTLTAIVGAETTEEDEVIDGREQKLIRAVSIHTDPDSTWGGVASPALTAMVTIGGVQYAIESIGSSDENWHTLNLTRRGKVEVSRRGYRR